MKYNYHGHTYRCGHADFSVSDEEYINKFIKNGFKKIAFTDHVPHQDVIDFRRNMRMDYSEKDKYLKSIQLLKEKYKDKIEILVGFEIEYLSILEDYLIDLKKESDILVLGQHFIYDEKFNDLKILRLDEYNDEDVINYANHIVLALEKKIPDIVVHPDIFVLGRCGFNEADEKATKMICEAALKYDIPLEINLTEAFLKLTGIRNNVRYPNKRFWEVVSNYNVKVLYGVDAHNLEQIELYDESIRLVNEIIGQDVIDKLNIIL